MRMEHEDKRDMVKRYLHKKHLAKIAQLEEFDRRGELSDRTMLAEAYESESTNQLIAENDALAEEYLRRTLRIHLELFEQGKQSEVENVIYCYRELAQMEEYFGTREQSEQYYQKAKEYEQYAAQQEEPEEDAWDAYDPFEDSDPDAISEIFARK